MDSLGHYILCDRYWEFLRLPSPRGLGIPPHIRKSKETALLLSDNLSSDLVIVLARGLYALYNTINALRFRSALAEHANFLSLMRAFAKRAF